MQETSVLHEMGVSETSLDMSTSRGMVIPKCLALCETSLKAVDVCL